MSAWRKRLGFITERFEAAGKQEKLKELPALSEANKGNTADKTSLDPVSILQAAQSVSDSAEVHPFSPVVAINSPQDPESSAPNFEIYCLPLLPLRNFGRRMGKGGSADTKFFIALAIKKAAGVIYFMDSAGEHGCLRLG